MKLNARIFYTLSLLAIPLCADPSSKNSEASAAPKHEEGISLLKQIKKAYVGVAKKAMPSTVYIKTVVEVEQQPFQDPFGGMQDDFFRQFFGQHFGQFPMAPQKPIEGCGSGFVVRPDGHVVTNFHVIKDATKITVTLNDGREYTATVKGTDPETDLAVLKIEETELAFLSFGDSDEIEVAEPVIAIGNTFGLEATLTTGSISAKGRQGLGIAPREDFIQTDAPINRGNSGGPLLNLDAEVIGINTAMIANGFCNGFAIPSNMARHVIDQIIDGGVVMRGFLGISPQEIDKNLVEAFSLPKQEGVFVADVTTDSPAAKAGLQQGDIILSYDGKSVKNLSKFRNDIALTTPGKQMNLKVLRDGEPITITVTVGSHSDKAVTSTEVLQKMGLEVENLSPEAISRNGYAPDTEGIMITKVKPGSQAASYGLRPGFLITEVAKNRSARVKIRNINDLNEALQESAGSKHLILIVQRQQSVKQWVTFKLN